MILSTLENGDIIKVPVDNITFDMSCDVLCVGAGCAGIYAADSAAREGASVILCEISTNIGGMHARGGVTGFYFGLRGGSHEQDEDRVKDDKSFLSGERHGELKQVFYVDRLQKSGVTLLTRTNATGVYFDGSRVVGLRAFDGVRELNIKAKITIDATSDGHLIRMIDVKKEYGRPIDQKYVPFTNGVKYTVDNGLWSCYDDSGYMDHYDEKDFSQRIISAHANASRLLSRGEFVNIASQLGIREGLIFEGEDRVTYGNILFERTPPKVLFWAYSDLDRHGSDRAIDEELFQNWWVIANLSTVTARIPVPMGSVVPKGVKGLVTAGRCLDCDTYSQSAIRMNRDMFRMGECVGVAAAMSAQSSVDFLDIDYNDFLSRVHKRGCFDGQTDRTLGFDNTYSHYLNKMRSLGRDPDSKYESLSLSDYIYEPIEFDTDKNFDLLKTDAPGVAVWSCYVDKDREALSERLYDEMCDANDNLYRYNCAIALGLIEDERTLPVLREIVDNRDCFFFTDNRRSNQFRSAIAVCLLGRMGTKDDLPRLFEILSDKEIERQMYHTLKADYLYHLLPDRNFVYFAMFTHACAAICKIYKRHGLNLGELNSFFKELFNRETTKRNITHQQSGQHAYEEMDGFMQCMLKLTTE